MHSCQPGILAPVPPSSRYLEFGALHGADVSAALRGLAAAPHDEDVVIGIGPGLVQGLGAEIEGLHAMPVLSGAGCEVPSTQADLWCFTRGDDRGGIVHKARSVMALLSGAFRCDHIVDGFKHDIGRDLTGYEDGTENPTGDDAWDAAIVSNAGSGLDGSSFVSVQQWVHDLDHFAALSAELRDHIIGRRIADNEEIDDAPDFAHVKRTAQENFEPEAFVVRRSMPWADAAGEGLMFVSFATSLYAFEAQLKRMVGHDDGIVDGLFQFTRPVTGSQFWCPPLKSGHLDLSAIGL